MGRSSNYGVGNWESDGTCGPPWRLSCRWVGVGVATSRCPFWARAGLGGGLAHPVECSICLDDSFLFLTLKHWQILKQRSSRAFYGSTKDFAEPGFDLSGLPQIAIYPFSSDRSWISKINTEKDRSLDWAFGLGQVAQHIRSHMWRRHLHTRHLGGAHSEFSSPCDFTRSTSVLSVKPGLLSFSVFDLGHP